MTQKLEEVAKQIAQLKRNVKMRKDGSPSASMLVNMPTSLMEKLDEALAEICKPVNKCTIHKCEYDEDKESAHFRCAKKCYYAEVEHLAHVGVHEVQHVRR